jgi:DNA-binding transcriptional MerR regulator
MMEFPWEEQEPEEDESTPGQEPAEDTSGPQQAPEGAGDSTPQPAPEGADDSAPRGHAEVQGEGSEGQAEGDDGDVQVQAGVEQQVSAPDMAAPVKRVDAGTRQLVRKEYYSISEVSDLVGLPAHVLRYWESQFSVLNPSKNRSGNRVYQRKEIKLILLVKKLLHDDKYTVEGAKQKLEQLRRGGSIGDAASRALDEQFVSVLRDELLALNELLRVEAK